MSNEIKVGVLVLIALVVLGYLVVKIEDFRGFDDEASYTAHVLFDNAAGLSVDDPVQVAGIQVGRVVDVTLTEDGMARVTLRLSRGVQLRQDARAVVGSTGMLGDRILDLQPGSQDAPPLPAGGTIGGGEPVSIDQLVTVMSSIAGNLESTSETISRVLGTEEGEASLRHILANMESLTGQLDTLISANRASVDRSLGTLDETLGNLNQMAGSLNDNLPRLVEDMRALSAEVSAVLADNEGEIDEATANLRNTSERLDRSAADLEEFLAKMNRGEGSVARLVNEPETVDRLNEALDAVDDTLAAADTFFRRVGEARFSFEWRSEFYQRVESSKNYFGLRLDIGDIDSNRAFLFHVVDDNVGGFDATDVTTQFFDPDTGDLLNTTVERRLVRQAGFRFSAVLAQRINNFQLRGGILESQAGLGMDYYLADDRMRVSAEIWDLGRDPDPHAKLRLQWNVAGRFFLTGGWDDILRENRRGFYLGGGYSFR